MPPELKFAVSAENGNGEKLVVHPLFRGDGIVHAKIRAIGDGKHQGRKCQILSFDFASETEQAERSHSFVLGRGRHKPGDRASARIVDADSGKPVARTLSFSGTDPT